MVARLHPWFALLGGAIAWTIHFMGSYAISEASCKLSIPDSIFLGLSLMQVLIILLTVGALILTLSAIWVSRSDQLLQLPLFKNNPENARFVQRVGSACNALFCIIILAETLPLVILAREC